MNEDGRKRVFAQLRATAAMLALLLSWLAPVLPLTALEPDFCSMECCVAEGHCCCAARKPFVKGRVPGADGRPVISENELYAACPLQCAQPSSGFHHLQFPHAVVVRYACEIAAARAIYVRTPRLARDALADEHSAPRAPPATLL